MSRLIERLRKTAQSWFPERQVLIRGPGRTTAIRISQRQQVLGATVVAFSLFWGFAVTVGMAVTVCRGAENAANTARLENQLSRREATLNALIAQNREIALQRDGALAQAQTMEAEAEKTVAATQAHARLAAAELEANANARFEALNQQTKTEIGEVQGIIHAAGLDPARLTGLPPANVDASSPDGAELLQRDLGRLHVLSSLLKQMPLASPVDEMSISSGFGYRASPFTGLREFHVGIDLRGPIGSPIYATAPGTVVFAGVQTGYGLIVEIDHGFGLSTRYSHLDRLLVKTGDKVALHQTVGLMGNTGWSTGPHLLYETRVDGQPDNPLNFMKVSANDVQTQE